MKTLHFSIIMGAVLGLSFWCPHFASAHIVPGFSIQPDQNYADSITHYLSTKDGHPIIVIKQDSEFTLPMTLKSENDSLSTTYSFLVTNDTDFTHKVILPEISIHVVPDHFIIPHGGDQKFDIVIKAGKNTPSGVYRPNLAISWNNNVTMSKEIAGIPFQVGKWNWNSLSKQIESGRTAEHVVCKSSDHIVVIKSEDGSPACVKSDSVSKLVLISWAKNPLSELLLKYINQTQANLVFYNVMNEPQVKSWSMTGWKYNSYVYGSVGDPQKFSATIHLYLPTNDKIHPECKNGSLAFVVMNLKPIEIEHNYTKVGCMPDYKDWNRLGSNLK